MTATAFGVAPPTVPPPVLCPACSTAPTIHAQAQRQNDFASIADAVVKVLAEVSEKFPTYAVELLAGDDGNGGERVTLKLTPS